MVQLLGFPLAMLFAATQPRSCCMCRPLAFLCVWPLPSARWVVLLPSPSPSPWWTRLCPYQRYGGILAAGDDGGAAPLTLQLLQPIAAATCSVARFD